MAKKIQGKAGGMITTDVPLSENINKRHENLSAEECIKELQRVALIDVEKVITRNYFRNESRIAESDWTRHFGTFEEFKRQANIMPTRQQHAIERHVAKHASVDHYRALNEEKNSLAEKYVRKNSKRYKTIIVASDLHDRECDPFYLKVLIDSVKRIQPDVVCFGGDIFDLPEFGKYGVDPREWDVVGRIKFVHKNIFKPIREACPTAQIDFIEGNHEARLLKHMADASPAMRAVLSDLHGFNTGKLLGLDEFEINYIAQADLGAWTKSDHEAELGRNFKVYWDSFLVHHFPVGMKRGLPGCHGHHHKHTVQSIHNHHSGSYEWHQLGCGHERKASYCDGEAWNLGFLIAHVDVETKKVAPEYIHINDHAVVGGQWYHRETRGRKPKSDGSKY